MKSTNHIGKLLSGIILLFIAGNAITHAQTSVFTYQGRLSDAGMPASGTYDMRFRLFDADTGGTQVGTTFFANGVPASAGIFNVELNFGAQAFSGADRFLEVAISTPAQNNFTTLAPRQKVNSAPYALKSLSAQTSSDSQSLGGTPADQFVLTNDSRMSDARTPTPGSGDYVQNRSTAQPEANFNVGGTGTAGVLNAVTQFNLGGQRILTANANGFFAGIGTGSGAQTTGNLFVGSGAGGKTTAGPSNSFLGNGAGSENVLGGNNTFVGFAAGRRNLTGNGNIFIGVSAGNPDLAVQTDGAIAIGNNAAVSQNNSIAIGNGVAVSTSNTIALGTLSHKTVLDGRLRTGAPVGVAAGDLPGRGYMETFFVSSVFQGIYTPNVIFGSYTSNPLGTVIPCVRFQGIPGQTAGVILANCDSPLSSKNNKTEVRPFTGGLDIVRRLEPVSFRHKEGGTPGVGLNAEDVADIDSSLVQRDDSLSINKVNETSLSMVLVNAVKQQQKLIENQDQQIRSLKTQLDSLKKLVCTINFGSEICKEN